MHEHFSVIACQLTHGWNHWRQSKAIMNDWIMTTLPAPGWKVCRYLAWETSSTLTSCDISIVNCLSGVWKIKQIWHCVVKLLNNWVGVIMVFNGCISVQSKGLSFNLFKLVIPKQIFQLLCIIFLHDITSIKDFMRITLQCHCVIIETMQAQTKAVWLFLY